jgi:hypothetical protein
VRKILAEQIDFQADGTEFVPAEELAEGSRYFMYQDIYNEGGVPSEQVIENIVEKKGKEYRQEVKGPHPVERFRLKGLPKSKGKKARQMEETRV